MSSSQDKIKNLSLSLSTRDEPKRKLKIKRKDHKNWRERFSNQEEQKTESIQPNYPIQEEKKEEYDLFNNPYISEAKKHLSQEKLEEYKRLGERFYAGWDFENGGPEKVLDVAVAEISEAIKSGLHPSDLDENEREIMVSKIGKDWYLDFGYSLEDLEKIRV